MKLQFLFTLPLLILLSCRPGVHSNLGVENWSGRLLDGSSIRFSEVEAPGLLVNFYSPICQPCIEEIYALEALGRRAAEMDIPLFIALENRPSTHGIDTIDDEADEEVRFQAIREAMLRDIERYGIDGTVVIMDDEFRISSRSIVTGTPETLFFSTDPLILEYTFLGPVSTRKDPEGLAADSRYQFAETQLERLRARAGIYSGPAERVLDQI